MLFEGVFAIIKAEKRRMREGIDVLRNINKSKHNFTENNHIDMTFGGVLYYTTIYEV